jgi:hypothetical protein
MFRLDLEAGPTAALARLGEPALDAYLKVGIKVCAKCQAQGQNQGWLKAEAVTKTMDPAGEHNEHDEVVVNNLILGPEVEEILRRFQGGKGPEGAEEPETAGKEKVTE